MALNFNKIKEAAEAARYKMVEVPSELVGSLTQIQYNILYYMDSEFDSKLNAESIAKLASGLGKNIHAITQELKLLHAMSLVTKHKINGKNVWSLVTE